MTKKDYIAAAKIVSAERIPGYAKLEFSPGIREEIAAAFVAFFRADNPKFDKNRFLNACGVSGVF